MNANEIVKSWNDAHPDQEPFEPWAGGDAAPEDWDQGDVLRYDGYVGSQDNPNGYTWKRGYDHKPGVDPADIIGIRRKRTAAAQPERRMTEAEARNLFRIAEGGAPFEGFVAMLENYIPVQREPTEATGLTVDVVQKVLEARDA